jgi:hypothetical protein
MSVIFRPTYLLDRETIIDRSSTVAMIDDSLRRNEDWKGIDAENRRITACRINFARWMAQVGEINDAS